MWKDILKNQAKKCPSCNETLLPPLPGMEGFSLEKPLPLHCLNKECPEYDMPRKLKKSYFDKKRGRYKYADEIMLKEFTGERYDRRKSGKWKPDSKAHEIMLERHGEDYRRATESVSPRHTKYGNEYMFYLKLISDKGMSKEQAAQQTYTPNQGPDDSETYF